MHWMNIAVLALVAHASPVRRQQNSSIALELSQRPSCSYPIVRREWGTFSLAERAAYITADKCMSKLPSKIPNEVMPGARNRKDDFIGTHINSTFHVHGDALFLGWHRQFVYLWEKALREECGYNGYQPYWNWPLWAADLKKSPLFDNSPTSFSGDGVYDPNAPQGQLGNLTFPRGNGGGCVVTGPYANTTLHFRNFAQSDATTLQGVLPADALEYSPHCLRRDLNSFAAQNGTSQAKLDYLMYETTNITDFQAYIDSANDGLGVHPGGHYTAGQDLWDFFTSPSDPVFFLHHGMIDLTYTIWQAQDPTTRQYAINGTSTYLNVPPSDEVGLDYELDFGYLAPKTKLGETLDVMKGPYCYQYDY